MIMCGAPISLPSPRARFQNRRGGMRSFSEAVMLGRMEPAVKRDVRRSWVVAAITRGRDHRPDESHRGPTMSATRHASCACGQLSVTCSGEPETVAVCHCLACQRRTGSAFGVSAWFRDQEIIAVDGRATQFVRVADGGGRVTFNFCPDCGATVHYTLDGEAGMLAIPVGAFADPRFPEPQASIYHDSRRHPWIEIRTHGPLDRRG